MKASLHTHISPHKQNLSQNLLEAFYLTLLFREELWELYFLFLVDAALCPFTFCRFALFHLAMFTLSSRVCINTAVRVLSMNEYE